MDGAGPHLRRQELTGPIDRGAGLSPTASNAPTRERTIEWQNASAETSTASTPGSSGSARTASVWSSRMVEAPVVRRLAVGGEVVETEEHPSGIGHPAGVQRT